MHLGFLQYLFWLVGVPQNDTDVTLIEFNVISTCF